MFDESDDSQDATDNLHLKVDMMLEYLKRVEKDNVDEGMGELLNALDTDNCEESKVEKKRRRSSSSSSPSAERKGQPKRIKTDDSQTVSEEIDDSGDDEEAGPSEQSVFKCRPIADLMDDDIEPDLETISLSTDDDEQPPRKTRSKGRNDTRRRTKSTSSGDSDEEEIPKAYKLRQAKRKSKGRKAWQPSSDSDDGSQRGMRSQKVISPLRSSSDSDDFLCLDIPSTSRPSRTTKKKSPKNVTISSDTEGSEPPTSRSKCNSRQTRERRSSTDPSDDDTREKSNRKAASDVPSASTAPTTEQPTKSSTTNTASNGSDAEQVDAAAFDHNESYDDDQVPHPLLAGSRTLKLEVKRMPRDMNILIRRHNLSEICDQRQTIIARRPRSHPSDSGQSNDASAVHSAGDDDQPTVDSDEEFKQNLRSTLRNKQRGKQHKPTAASSETEDVSESLLIKLIEC